MALFEGIQLIIIVISLYFIWYIYNSAGFKESSYKDGSRVVNIIFMLLLWILSCFLSYSFYPKLVLYFNGFIIVSYFPYASFFKFMYYLFDKVKKMIIYYYELYIKQYLNIVLNFIDTSLKMVVLTFDAGKRKFIKYVYLPLGKLLVKCIEKIGYISQIVIKYILKPPYNFICNILSVIHDGIGQYMHKLYVNANSFIDDIRKTLETV